MLSEFKAFIMRGNVLDLAVAVIIGGAFGKIVTSFVNDVILPRLLDGELDLAFCRLPAEESLPAFIDCRAFFEIASRVRSGSPWTRTDTHAGHSFPLRCFRRQPL